MDFVPQAGEVGSCSPFSDFVGPGSCGNRAQAVGVLWHGKWVQQSFTGVPAFMCEQGALQ